MPGIALFFFIFMGIFFTFVICFLIYKGIISKQSKNKSPKPASLFGQKIHSPNPMGNVYTVTNEQAINLPTVHQKPSHTPHIVHSIASGPEKKPLSHRDISNPIPIQHAPWVTPATPYHTPNSGMTYH